MDDRYSLLPCIGSWDKTAIIYIALYFLGNQFLEENVSGNDFSFGTWEQYIDLNVTQISQKAGCQIWKIQAAMPLDSIYIILILSRLSYSTSAS